MEEKFIRMQISGKNHAGQFEGKERLVTAQALVFGQGFQEEGFRVANGLDALEGEITGETRKHKSGSIDGGFPDDAFESGLPSQEAKLKVAGVLFVEPFDGYGVALHITS
jgi:hypothetical protein